MYDDMQSFISALDKKGKLRKIDVAARYGGEEFVIITTQLPMALLAATSASILYVVISYINFL